MTSSWAHRASYPNRTVRRSWWCAVIWSAVHLSLSLPSYYFADCPFQFLASAPADIVQSRSPVCVRAASSSAALFIALLIFKFLHFRLSTEQRDLCVLLAICLLHLIANVCTCSARWSSVVGGHSAGLTVSLASVRSLGLPEIELWRSREISGLPSLWALAKIHKIMYTSAQERFRKKLEHTNVGYGGEPTPWIYLLLSDLLLQENSHRNLCKPGKTRTD